MTLRDVYIKKVQRHFLTYAQPAVQRELVAVIAHTEECAHRVHTLPVSAQAPLRRTLVDICSAHKHNDEHRGFGSFRSFTFTPARPQMHAPMQSLLCEF